MDSPNQYQRIDAELIDGYRIQRIFGRLRKVPTSKNRRKMLEERLRLDEKQLPKWVWKSIEPIHEWDDEKRKYVFKGFRRVHGTYERRLHGPWHDLRP